MRLDLILSGGGVSESMERNGMRWTRKCPLGRKEPLMHLFCNIWRGECVGEQVVCALLMCEIGELP